MINQLNSLINRLKFLVDKRLQAYIKIMDRLLQISNVMTQMARISSTHTNKQLQLSFVCKQTNCQTEYSKTVTRSALKHKTARIES